MTSSAIELAGFTCLTVAAFLFAPIAGFATAGMCLLVMGYGTDDRRASMSIRRAIDPARQRLNARRARRRERHQAKKG